MNRTQEIRHRYNRIAPCYNAMDALMELRLFRAQRGLLLQEVRGDVLEVGVGTGKNLPYYPSEISLTAVDFSPRMLERARHQAQRLSLDVTLMEMDVQALEFAEDSFDCVVSTCVFCSVPDPIVGLREIRRVCKPGGRILMLEHMRSERPVLGLLMDLFNFMPLHLYGANINRRTLENLRIAGFSQIYTENVWGDIFKQILIDISK